MSTKDKLIERFKTLPKDFTFSELLALFKAYAYLKHLYGILAL